MRSACILFFAVSLVLCATPCLAESGDDHPDLAIGADGMQLELQGFPVAFSHTYYEFINAFGSGSWITLHDSLTWPGIGAEDGTFPGSTNVDFIIKTALHYWDGASVDGFAPAATGQSVTLKASAFAPEYTITGSMGQQTCADFVTADSGGGIHAHPSWQGYNNGSEPLDGAYLIGVAVDADGYVESNLQGVLLHKGLNDTQYKAAVGHAFGAGIGLPQRGDANRDGLVNDDDLSLLLATWNQQGEWATGDFSGDCIVDDDDLSLLLSNWTVAPTGQVPEPATLLLLAIGAAGWRRRRG